MGYAFGTLLFACIFYFVSTRKQIDYDDIKQVVFVIDKRHQTEIEIPVEKIEMILKSALGFGRSDYSYIIVYKDCYNQTQKVRLFPIPFDNSIKTIIADTKLKNPNLVTRNLRLG